MTGDGPSGLLAVIDPSTAPPTRTGACPSTPRASACSTPEGPRVGVVVEPGDGRALRGRPRRRGGKGRPAASRRRAATTSATPSWGSRASPGCYPGWAQFRALGAASLECCAVAEGVLDAYAGGRAEHALRLGLPGRAAHLPRGGRGGGRARTGGTWWYATHRAAGPSWRRRPSWPTAWWRRPACDRRRRRRCGHARPGGRSSRCTAWCTSCPRRPRPTSGSASRDAPATSRRGRRRWVRCGQTWWSRRSSTSTRSWCTRRSPTHGRSRRPSSWWRRASPRWTRPAAGCWAMPYWRSDEMRRAADLARTAAEEAGRRAEGRPLAAAHADVAWPDEPHLVLWHAQSILREYRGDGHIALLVVHGLSGIEALVTHAAAGDVPARVAALDPGLAAGGVGLGGRRRCAGGAGSSGETSSVSPIGAPPSAAPSRTGPTPWPRRPTTRWATPRCTELRALARPWSTIFADGLALIAAPRGLTVRVGITARALAALGRLAQLVRAAGLQPKWASSPRSSASQRKRSYLWDHQETGSPLRVESRGGDQPGDARCVVSAYLHAEWQRGTRRDRLARRTGIGISCRLPRCIKADAGHSRTGVKWLLRRVFDSSDEI